MQRSVTERAYRRGDATAYELQEVVDEVLGELAAPDSEASRAAAAAGIRREDLAEAQVFVREGQQGAEPITTTILVGIAVKVGADAAEGLWSTVLWPRVRRRLGTRALGQREQEPRR